MSEEDDQTNNSIINTYLKNKKSLSSHLNLEIKSFIPKGSLVMKQGELYKVGSLTGIHESRYYILRDNALYIYKNRE